MTYYPTSCLRRNHAEPPTLDTLVCSTLSIEIALTKRKWIGSLVMVKELSLVADLQRIVYVGHHGGLGTPVRANNSRTNSLRPYRL